MSVRIRMKMLGRKHRAFFRICALDQRRPRNGRVLEELGTYDPQVPETDARALINGERVSYWLGVGAQPSEKVSVLIKKYGPNGTHLEAQREALARLAAGRTVAQPGVPVYVHKTRAELAAEEAQAAQEAAEQASQSNEADASGSEGETSSEG